MFKLFEVKEGKFEILPSVRVNNLKGFMENISSFN